MTFRQDNRRFATKAFRDLGEGDVIVIEGNQYTVISLTQPIDQPNGLWKAYLGGGKLGRYFEYPDTAIEVILPRHSKKNQPKIN